ncbi:3'(2'),5'-bisphosphate nucleotidase CysQ [Oleiphilus sp. HI0071]|jgi:3'(2'), 5'-bisphosphate nucleotidase|nr:3'(2'),5'-bisphosphate nucleotidase CysQ [Oleiphilus sp. HI0065]KZY82329.1 3'(2'),5'-bisphosphate nucleotidase CysQ [Oleiphilus sp. HI0071]KZZ06207.1 3'(2'),5'-bisphosphate nucleotidase CysQ [Oleiphilus sp. HI0073]KZZ13548.1 3'(2'),5'-bisphosphate nucleotidase CysQ [Oleiphilus sp. HI0079]KZZ17357.1 3'(2'),5'-bisphosphate nucleotidase CysQ [Oleiphilus sp. HI0080]KZZ40429.1 3'(2'),5'-bisphosphate nucleotidase CysQ [Oleiphilus sp. HI0118]KZZ57357.1 3'(2'),5'-bisphosphate nucleotidase CysQ [Ol
MEDMSDLRELFPALERIVREAGQAILKVYQQEAPLDIDTKSDDSPVTQADIAAHRIIEKSLLELTPDIPILSEEGGLPGYDIRGTWSEYWLVDPLDGTKEFINKNGEFTVNIALIRDGEAILGYVYVPVLDKLYFGGTDFGSVRKDRAGEERLEAQALKLGGELKVVGSRRHGAEALDDLLNSLSQDFSNISRIDMGSSLKICACAEGSADWYPRLALTSEWDTAAAHAVLKGAGGEIYKPDLTPLQYNTKEDILNPHFHAVGDVEFPWPNYIKG